MLHVAAHDDGKHDLGERFGERSGAFSEVDGDFVWVVLECHCACAFKLFVDERYETDSSAGWVLGWGTVGVTVRVEGGCPSAGFDADRGDWREVGEEDVAEAVVDVGVMGEDDKAAAVIDVEDAGTVEVVWVVGCFG